MKTQARPATPRTRAQTSLTLMLHLSHRLADLGLAEADERPGLAKEWISLATELDIPLEASGILLTRSSQAGATGGCCSTSRPYVCPILPSSPKVRLRPRPMNRPCALWWQMAIALTRHRIMKLLVEEGGHFVYPVEDGNAALALAMEVLPHVIIAHHNLPRLSGPDLCQALRATDEGQRMHILLMADDDDEAQLAQAYEVGADAYASSTISAMGLRARLHAAQASGAVAKRLVEGSRPITADRCGIGRGQPTAGERCADRFIDRTAQSPFGHGPAHAGMERGHPLRLPDFSDGDRYRPFQAHQRYLWSRLGDIVLREVASSLRASARREDSVCRIGGEEFLVICPTPISRLRCSQTERLRANLEVNGSPSGRPKKPSLPA